MVEKIKNWHDKHYKKLMIITALILIASLSFILVFYQQTGDIISRDISIEGGTSVTVFNQTDMEDLENFLAENFETYDIRSIQDLRTREQQAFVVEVTEEPENITRLLEEYLGYELDSENSSVEFTGAAIGAGFFNQLLRALLTAFVLMALVVFLIFGGSNKMKAYTSILAATIIGQIFWESSFILFLAISLASVAIITSLYFDKEQKDYIYTAILFALFMTSLFFSNIYFTATVFLVYFAIIFSNSVPSLAVVLSAFSDIMMTLALVNLLGMRVSSAGIAAFLMLIGYSVDSDILMTTKILKRREGSLNSRILSAFKTGMTMALTTLVALSISLVIVMSLSRTLFQLFSILVIGLSFDLINTWISNLGILKWYSEKRGIK